MELSNTIYVFKHNVTGVIKHQSINVCFDKHFKLIAVYHLTSIYY